MKYRTLGKTGLRVSEIGFGCGSVGGIMIRGDHGTRVRGAARAIELGVNYFDTASSYGDGQSETHLGEALDELGADVLVGTKVRLTAADMEHLERAVVASVEASLRRLGRERVDLIQLHNAVGARRQPERGWVGLHDLPAIVQTFGSLQQSGKVRFWGITALGETEALHTAVSTAGLHTIQTCYNLINPSSGQQVGDGWPFQDYGQLIDRAAENGIGTIAIRVLAAGALSGIVDRHPLAAPSVAPIASGRDLGEDVERAQAFAFLVEDGYADTLVEAALRFALSKAQLSIALVGISSMEQLEQAAAYEEKGPLPPAALARLRAAWTH